MHRFFPDSTAMNGFMNGFKLQYPQQFLHDGNRYISFKQHSTASSPSVPPPPPPPPPPALSTSISSESERVEESDYYSNINLNYISRMLMEEDIDEKVRSYQEESALRAAEKPFYDILSQKYPASPDHPSLPKSHDSEPKEIQFLKQFEIEEGSRGRKNLSREDLALEEGRITKQSALSSGEILRSKKFDFVLLFYEGKCEDMDALRLSLQREASKNSSQDTQSKARGKKQSKKKEVDLRTLLIHCAQAVATENRRSANDLLRQIRQHSSPTGDANQRLAYCFADGLEARMAGIGSQIYQSLVAKRTTASAVLQAYHLYLAACPFKRISHFMVNQTIQNLAEKAARIHIVDFGIYFGFQWPSLIQRLASIPGGPPRVRITGIDVPQPGFRPTERIEETGRRLADYAQSFNVPFEYYPIASRWEAIRAEDISIEKDEVVIVTCLYRFKNLVDETVVEESPRNTVLDAIRKLNPTVFIHGIVNGSYGAPFFVTRFREALFHYSSLFDMLETIVPREDAERLLIEKDLFGREALNVIACEGSERVERPETYKQWQVRNLRAGFEQLPLRAELMKKARERVRGSYHKDFVIDEESRWLLQGWKGRIIYALSMWRPSRDW